MLRKSIMLFVTVIAVSSGLAQAADANGYIAEGRGYMFNGTLTGLRQAYETFDGCINNPACPDCDSNRELIFLHSITRIAMWGVRDNGGDTDSALEFARKFGITLSGDYYEELDINKPVYPSSTYGEYEMPAENPTVGEIRTHIFDELLPGFEDFIGETAIPEIESVIAELDTITETPSDRFSVIFYPDETGLTSNLEIDYADVLVLKGVLYLVKSRLESQSAYDLFTDANDIIIEKLLYGGLQIQDGLIARYPNLLKVLPTPGHAIDGNAILAEAKQSILDGIDCYFDAVDYMLGEDDPQDDDFLSIDPRNNEVRGRIEGIFSSVRDNLTTGTPFTQSLGETATYTIRDSNGIQVGTLVLEYEATGQISGGTLNIQITDGDEKYYAYFEVKDAEVDEFGFIAEVETSDYWTGGLLSGIMSANGSVISGVTFEYWGDYSGTAGGLSASRTGIVRDDIQVDLNPLYGATPVSPRDILPGFDRWNEPVLGTFGAGLGNDATLGGIVPGFTQDEWRRRLDLQPGGLFYLQEIMYPWQKRYYDEEPFVSIWFGNQLIFSDPGGDADKSSTLVKNVDIESLYMGYDDDRLYGTIFFHDYDRYNEAETAYELTLSYNHDNPGAIHGIKFRINRHDDWGDGELLYLYSYYEYEEPYWEYMESFPVHVGQGGIDFSVPWEYMPDYLPGRFVSLSSRLNDYYWEPYSGGERNNTNLQIGEIGNISGTITCAPACYKGAPILVEAFTDGSDPEGTVVARTVIEQPGPYVLESVGLGWYGWVRATMACHKFDACGIDVRDMEAYDDCFMGSVDTTTVNLTLGSCTTGCETAGMIRLDDYYYGSVPYSGEAWYAFVADINAVYSVDVAGIDARVSIFDNCFGDELISGYSYDQLNFSGEAGRTYYIRIGAFDEGGGVEIMVSHNGEAITNDRCETAIEAATDVNYTGTTIGALCDSETDCGYGDDYDVWYKFTPVTGGIYEVNLMSGYYSATAAVYDGCGGEEILCRELWYGQSTFYFNCKQSRTYYIRIALQDYYTGTYSLIISYYGGPVSNDECEDAAEITAYQDANVSTFAALGDDIWYRFVPATSGLYDINVVSGYYRDVKVLDKCEGDSVLMGAGWPEYFKAQQGIPCLVSVKGYDDVNVVFRLTYGGTAPANDDRQDAIAIEPGHSYPGTTERATKDGRSVCGGDSADVWYVFTPVKNGIYRIYFTEGDTLAVFETGFFGWTDRADEIACLDYWDEHPTYFYARAATAYYIRVAGRWDDTGPFSFVLDEVSIMSLAGDLTGDNFVGWADLDVLCYYWLMDCAQPYGCGGADFSGNRHVEFEDFAVMAEMWLESEQ